MYRYLSLFLATSTLLYSENTNVKAPTLTPPAAPAQQAQSIHSDAPLNIDGRKWKLGHESKEEGGLIREYVLENEDPNNWTELFSIQQFSEVPVTPQEFYKLFVDGLKQSVPQNKVENRIVSESPNVLLGEWWIHDKSQNDQHEWVKIFKDGDEVLIVRYTTKKTKDVDSIRKKWEDILTNFNARKG